jgi:hypothetical protein
MIMITMRYLSYSLAAIFLHNRNVLEFAKQICNLQKRGSFTQNREIFENGMIRL